MNQTQTAPETFISWKTLNNAITAKLRDTDPERCTTKRGKLELLVVDQKRILSNKHSFINKSGT
jgi:hypothetical protein